jgi:hypothetical protein
MDEQIADHLRQLEKLLREADTRLEAAGAREVVKARRQRNAINAACNALHRAATAQNR